MSKEGKEKVQKLVKEILDISFPLCKHEDPNVCQKLAILNSKAYEVQKLLDRKEIE